MKNKIHKIGEIIFAIGIMIALVGSGILFILLVASIIIGNGELAVFARHTLMPRFIQAGAIALIGGLVSMYFSGKHELTMD